MIAATTQMQMDCLTLKALVNSNFKVKGKWGSELFRSLHPESESHPAIFAKVDYWFEPHAMNPQGVSLVSKSLAEAEFLDNPAVYDDEGFWIAGKVRPLAHNFFLEHVFVGNQGEKYECPAVWASERYSDGVGRNDLELFPFCHLCLVKAEGATLEEGESIYLSQELNGRIVKHLPESVYLFAVDGASGIGLTAHKTMFLLAELIRRKGLRPTIESTKEKTWWGWKD